MRALRAIVFDFDGVILESVDIKTRAFRELLPGRPALQDRLERHHLAHLGVSRYEKFEWICRELLAHAPSREEIADLDRRFSAAIALHMRTCAFVPGAREFLLRHADKEPLYVASATPEIELRHIVEDRALTTLFKGIYGFPTTKADALARVVRDVGGAPEDVLFVGDSRQDAEAARAVGVTFVARVASADARFTGSAMRVADLAELERRLAEL